MDAAILLQTTVNLHMAKIPEPKNSLAALIDLHHEQISEQPRGHMGCSQLGHPCDRWLWLSFRWAVIEKFPGRVLRMFRRGRNEEAIIVDDLRAAGITIHSTEGSQSRVSLGCHIGGSIDGIIEYGVPEAPQKRHIVEFKTHSLKSFEDLLKNGVASSKPQHWTQMQLYMMGTIMGKGLESPGIDRALYVAICKDDDRIYTERVRFDPDHAKNIFERGKRIVLADEMPAPISTNPSWYQCKWCAAHSLCHGKKPTVEVNCRTCIHAVAQEDGTWFCERHQEGNIPLDYQREGCNGHVLHPDLVPWQMMGPADGDNCDAMFEINGKQVRNGAGGYSSREILANPDLCAEDVPFINTLRSEMGGRIIG